MPSLAEVAWIALTASPSEVPGARLNETVVAGNCPWWLITSGPVVLEKRVTALKGTCPCGPVVTAVPVAFVPAAVVPVAVVTFAVLPVADVTAAVVPVAPVPAPVVPVATTVPVGM